MLKSNKLYNIQNIYDLASGDHEFVKKLINIFIAETPNTINDMFNAHKNGDIETLRRLAHRIKPSLKNLEINSVLPQINDIELGIEKHENEQKLRHITNVLVEVVMGLKADLAEVHTY